MMAAMKTPLITLYGIPNCDTVKKARAWLTGQGLDHTFHDFKKQGVPAERLPDWLALASSCTAAWAPGPTHFHHGGL